MFRSSAVVTGLAIAALVAGCGGGDSATRNEVGPPAEDTPVAESPIADEPVAEEPATDDQAVTGPWCDAMHDLALAIAELASEAEVAATLGGRGEQVADQAGLVRDALGTVLATVPEEIGADMQLTHELWDAQVADQEVMAAGELPEARDFSSETEEAELRVSDFAVQACGFSAFE